MSGADFAYRPGDSVRVVVHCANLIQFYYQIRLAKEEEIEKSINVVGAGFLTSESKSIGIGKSDVEAIVEEITGRISSDSGLTLEAKSFDKPPHMVVTGFIHAVRLVENLLLDQELNPDRMMKHDGDSCKWDQGLKNIVSALKTVVPKINFTLDYLERDILNKKLGLIQDGSDSAKKMITYLDSTVSRLVWLRNRAEVLLSTIARWELTMQHDPKLEQVFLIEDMAKRYVVQVRRSLQGSSNRIYSSDPGSPDTAIVASIAYEGRPLAYLNISAGLAGVVRPDMGAISLLQGEDGKYYVSRPDPTSFSVPFVVTIGFYLFGGYDYLAPNKCGKLMLVAGTEISTSPEIFLVGLSYDIPWGLVIGAGITPYEKIVPAHGWKEGEYIPEDPANLPTVATESQTAIGYYFTLQFTPAVFNAFRLQ